MHGDVSWEAVALRQQIKAKYNAREQGREEGIKEVLDSIEKVLELQMNASEKIKLIKLYIERSK